MQYDTQVMEPGFTKCHQATCNSDSDWITCQKSQPMGAHVTNDLYTGVPAVIKNIFTGFSTCNDDSDWLTCQRSQPMGAHVTNDLYTGCENKLG